MPAPPTAGSASGTTGAPPMLGTAPGSTGAGFARGTARGSTGTGFAPGGGRRFGGNNAAVTAAVTYAKAHGGGAVAVSSQQGASASIIRSGADVVAIGGFSGRESQVSIKWFAQQVAAGKIRWVVADSDGGMPSDGRTGSKDVMAAIAKTRKATTTSAGTIYDCQGYASSSRHSSENGRY